MLSLSSQLQQNLLFLHEHKNTLWLCGTSPWEQVRETTQGRPSPRVKASTMKGLPQNT